MKDYYCTWLYKDVQPTNVTCFWLLGKKPECDGYCEHEPKGRCVFLAERI